MEAAGILYGSGWGAICRQALWPRRGRISVTPCGALAERGDSDEVHKASASKMPHIRLRCLLCIHTPSHRTCMVSSPHQYITLSAVVRHLRSRCCHHTYTPCSANAPHGVTEMRPLRGHKPGFVPPKASMVLHKGHSPRGHKHEPVPPKASMPLRKGHSPRGHKHEPVPPKASMVLHKAHSPRGHKSWVVYPKLWHFESISTLQSHNSNASKP